MASAKKAVLQSDLLRRAVVSGVEATKITPPQFRTLNVQRLLCAAAPQQQSVLVPALYNAVWEKGADLSNGDQLQAVVESVVGTADAKMLLNATKSEDIKKTLEHNTAEAVSHGAFGVPCYFLSGLVPGHPLLKDAPDDTSCFIHGEDRLPFVSSLLSSKRPWSRPEPPLGKCAPGAHVECFYDFSSPFAYLGFTQIERVASAVGAPVKFRPMLLGALFKEIGTPMLPMSQMPDAKR